MRYSSFLGAILCLILTVRPAGAINLVSEGFKVNASSFTEIDAHGTCRRVTNSGPRDHFVSTRTSTEWSRFLSQVPPSLAVGVCTDPCNASPTPGTVCTGGAIFLGSLSPGAVTGSGTDRYMTTAGGCGEIPAGSISGGSGATAYADADFTPTCSGTDALTKYWNAGTTSWYDIPLIVNEQNTHGTTFAAINTDQNYGSHNTAQIVAITAAAQGGRHAGARYCDKLNLGGYTDWFLPNRRELSLVYTNRASLPGVNTTPGTGYWSTTEFIDGGGSDSHAWFQMMSNGQQDTTFKNVAGLIRCVRRF